MMHACKLANVFEIFMIFADYSTSSDWKLDKMINRNGMHSMTCFSTIDFAVIMIFEQFEVVLRPLPIMDENYNGHFFLLLFSFLRVLSLADCNIITDRLTKILKGYHKIIFFSKIFKISLISNFG